MDQKQDYHINRNSAKAVREVNVERWTGMCSIRCWSTCRVHVYCLPLGRKAKAENLGCSSSSLSRNSKVVLHGTWHEIREKVQQCSA
jgi:hypothetical protein